MNVKRYILLAIIGLFAAILISGCSGYGKLYPSRYDEKVTIQDLIENYEDYDVYFSGYDTDNPSGIMFDPRNDNRTLKPSDRWMKIEDQETASEVVGWIQIQDLPSYYVGLRRILGPDDHLYGYLFSVWHHVYAKVVDERTLLVYDLPEPPYYYGPEAERRDR